MFHDLKKLLPASLVRSGASRQVKALSIVELFNKLAPEILGEDIGKEVEALFIRNGALSVKCSSSLVRQELLYKADEIITALNEDASLGVVKKINYTN